MKIVKEQVTGTSVREGWGGSVRGDISWRGERGVVSGEGERRKKK